MKNSFSKKVAREIANSNFLQTLDSILGYSDPDYSFRDETSTFEENFEEDLVNRGIISTMPRLRVISEEYDKIKNRFEIQIRKRYYK